MAERSVAADASPLIGLVAGGGFDLLRRLFGRVYVTRSVRDEVWAGQPGSSPQECCCLQPSAGLYRGGHNWGLEESACQYGRKIRIRAKNGPLTAKGDSSMQERTGSALLFESIDKRIGLDRTDSDFTYFISLSLKLEYLTKIVTSGLISCIGDDVDRHRYALEYDLVRADSLGKWVEVLRNALAGPAAQFFDPEARSLVRELNERVGPEDWRHSAVVNLIEAAKEVGVVVTPVGRKVALRQYFDIGVVLRNRSRGHGAPTNIQCGRACSGLVSSLETIVRNLRLFQLPWAYLYRNLSGKYRVSSLCGDDASFDYLKRQTDINLPNGTYIYLRRPMHVRLVFSDPDVRDIFLPNGNHRSGNFEGLSYVTNEIERQDISMWSDPPAALPPSETEGAKVLEPFGNTFTNVPQGEKH